MVSREYVKNNIVTIAISLFVAAFFLFTMSKGTFIYTKDGTLRQFGVGRSRSTVIPSLVGSDPACDRHVLFCTLLLIRSNALYLVATHRLCR